jgi:hypothetical protein
MPPAKTVISLAGHNAVRQLRKLKHEYQFTRAARTQRRTTLSSKLYAGIEMTTVAKPPIASAYKPYIRVIAVDGDHAIVRGLNWLSPNGEPWFGYMGVKTLIHLWKPAIYEQLHHRSTQAWADNRATQLARK